jgi:hypothetical protein
LWVRETYKGEVISESEREGFATQGDMIERASGFLFKPPMLWQTKGDGLFVGPTLRAEGTR